MKSNLYLNYIPENNYFVIKIQLQINLYNTALSGQCTAKAYADFCRQCPWYSGLENLCFLEKVLGF